jgi:hypothetical protein
MDFQTQAVTLDSTLQDEIQAAQTLLLDNPQASFTIRLAALNTIHAHLNRLIQQDSHLPNSDLLKAVDECITQLFQEDAEILPICSAYHSILSNVLLLKRKPTDAYYLIYLQIRKKLPLYLYHVSPSDSTYKDDSEHLAHLGALENINALISDFNNRWAGVSPIRKEIIVSGCTYHYYLYALRYQHRAAIQRAKRWQHRVTSLKLYLQKYTLNYKSLA